MLPKISLNFNQSQQTSNPPQLSKNSFPKMSSKTKDYLLRHQFTSLNDEDTEFTNGHSETKSHLLDHLRDEEAQEIEEALKVLA